MTYPLTPPPELVQQLAEQAPRYRDGGVGREVWLINRAYSAGADQELEACRMEIVDGVGRIYLDETKHRVLLAEGIWIARRPKPPSLKEQALSDLKNAYNADTIDDTTFENIRDALEALPDDQH